MLFVAATDFYWIEICKLAEKYSLYLIYSVLNETKVLKLFPANIK